MSGIADFLRTVWSKQPQSGYGTIARKRDDLWTERYLRSDRVRIRGERWATVHDLYFTPNLFSARNHRAACMLPSCVLYADLDEVDPAGIEPQLEPNVWWPTSRGRYQALWWLDRPLERGPFEALNHKLSYHLGADRNGWDAGQLLRLPFTVNTKRAKPYRIKMVCVTGRKPHRYEDLCAPLRHVQVAPATTAAVPTLPAPSCSSADVLKKYARKLPHSTRRTLKADTAYGYDRSVHLWNDIYPELVRAGLTPEEAFVLVKDTVWNKWPRSPQRLWADVYRGYSAHTRFSRAGAEDRANRPLPRHATPRENGGRNG